MIPKLFAANATKFTSNGLGRLSDAVECTVTEERNGPYELYMQYPVTGKHYSDIQISRIIYAVPADGKTGQPFRIYRIEKPLNGIVSIYAEHISYQLNHIPVMPFSATSCTQALTKMVNNSAQANPFTVWTNKSVSGNFNLTEPRAFRALLGGTQGSILDVYGKGEYEFDNYTVKLHLNRGTDTGIVLRYGNNITDLRQDENIETTITGVCPFWHDMTTGETVTLPENAVWSDTAANFPYKRTAVVDFTTDFQEKPTVEQLRARANQYIEDNDIGIPKVSLDVQFVPLWQMDGVSTGNPTRTLILPVSVDGDTVSIDGTVEDGTVTVPGAYWDVTFDDYKVLERVHLCDTLTIRYDALGVDATAKIVKTVYNVLTDRYDSLEVGDARTNLAAQIAGVDDSLERLRAQMENERSTLQAYVDHQTELITGGLGGFVVFNYNSNGTPQELLIMDSADMASAVNVIRMNKNGIGFSHTGYNGPFTSAWTIDGVFNADFIGAGVINANLIKAGLLTDEAGLNSWNLLTGALALSGDITMTKQTTAALVEAKLGRFSYNNYMGVGVSVDGLQIARTANSSTVTNKKSITNNREVIEYTATSSSDSAVGTTELAGMDIRDIHVTGPSSSHATIERVNQNYYSLLRYTNIGSSSASNAGSFTFGGKLFQYQGTGGTADTPVLRVNSSGVFAGNGESSSSSNYMQLNSTAFTVSIGGDKMIYNNPTGYLKVNGRNVAFGSSSSERYKHGVAPLDDERDPHRLLDLEPKQYIYNEGHPLQYKDMEGQTLPGFIAEDVERVYPSAVIRDADGNVESWDERRLIPGMLALIQEQQKRIEKLEEMIGRMMSDAK